jgi:hypothetical protein
MARPHIEPYLALRTPWRRFTLPGFPRGMLTRALSIDADSGACSLAVRWPAGCRLPRGLSYSEFELFLLKGDLSIGARRVQPGHYLWVPAGVALDELTTSRGCEMLWMYNYGEPSFAASDTDHPLAERALMVDINAYEDLAWLSGRRNPAVAPGCMVKVLRVDPVTRGNTFLYCMTPNFWQDNISYHDCCEESYHIWGTSHMMQFGDLPTGGYFWRPPYINHGAFSSKLGCLALGRTDSELYNYFHFNPWTNVLENKDRALRMLVNERPRLHEWALAQDGHNHPAAPHTHYDQHGNAYTHSHAAVTRGT